MSTSNGLPTNKSRGFSKLRHRITSPCKRLLSRYLRPIKKRTERRSFSRSAECVPPESTIRAVEPSAADETEHRTDSRLSSSLLENAGGAIFDSNDQIQRSAGSVPAGHGEWVNSPSRPSSLGSPAQAAVDEGGDGNEDEEEMISSHELSFLLRNAEFNRERDIQELEEEHAAKLASVTEERDQAIQVVKELTTERNQVVQASQHWQLKFVQAVAKIHKPNPIRGLATARALRSPPEEDDEGPLPSRVDRWLTECSGNQSITTDSEEDQRVIRQEDQLGWDQEEQQEERDGLVFPGPSESSSGAPESGSDHSNLYPIVNSNVPEARPPSIRTQLANCLRELEELRAKELPDFQLRQDLIQARETKEMLQQQLQSQTGECLYMRGIFSTLMDKIVRLNHENANPRDRLEAAIGEGLVHAANYERIKSTLATVKKELRVANRRGRSRKLPPLRRLKTHFTGRVNLKPYQAEVMAHDRLRREAIQQGAVHLDKLRTAVSMLKDQAQGDELSLKLADFLGDTLDRNEVLEREVWNLRHPVTLDYLYLPRDYSKRK